MRLARLGTLLAMCLLLYPLPAHAASIEAETDIVIFDMDYREAGFEVDPQNQKPEEKWPAIKSATSTGSIATASLAAVAGEAGVAKASVGINVEWEHPGRSFEEIRDIPIEVQIHFRYSVSATFTPQSGSSNAGISIPGLLNTPWFDFYGHAQGGNGGIRASSERVTFTTSPGQIRDSASDQIRLQVYAQAHVVNNREGVQNQAAADVEIYSIAIRWRPPEPDLEATGLEVTQGVQDLNNSVPLVTRKETYVRFHVRSLNANAYPSDALLRVTRGNQTTYLRPIHPTRTINVRPTPARGQLVHAFLFKLPTSMTRGGAIQLRAEVNPNRQSPVESDYTNNMANANVEFEDAPTLHVIFYRISYNHNGTRTIAPISHVEATESWLRRAYPIHKLRSYRRTLHSGDGLPEADDVNELLTDLQKRHRSAETNIVYAEGTRYYGMVINTGGWMRGLAVSPTALPAGGGGLTYVASGPTGIPSGFTNWDTDGSFGDWYTGHELGHTYARRHPGHPESASCQPQNRDARHGDGDHLGGFISPTNRGPTAVYGFDIETHAIYPPRPWTDMMTYCRFEWISDFTYTGLLRHFQTSPVASADVAVSHAGHSHLLVLGTIDPKTNVGQLRTPFVIPEATNVPDLVPGDYAIVLFNSDGDELARHAFTPATSVLEPDLTGAATEEAALLLVNELIPVADSATRLIIEHQGQIVAEVSAGASAPTVELTTPNGGETIGGENGGENVTVAWTGDDVDGDPLTYSVEYSPDGDHWEMVAQFLVDTSIIISTSNLMTGDSARFRVWASDGLNTSRDDSDATFTVPNHLPAIQILSPISGTTVVVSETVALAASAYDIDLGTITDEMLTWSSSLDGELGTGAALDLETLQPGIHTIVLEADDGAGGVVSDTTVMTVTLFPALVPAASNRLLVYPDVLIFAVAANTMTDEQKTTVYVDNENPDNILTWSASSNQPWLAVETSLGAAPGAFTVTLASLPAGSETLTATLSLESPDGVDPLEIPVTVARVEPAANGTGEIFLPFVVGAE